MKKEKCGEEMICIRIRLKKKREIKLDINIRDKKIWKRSKFREIGKILSDD